MRKLIRWFLKHCMDCGCRLSKEYSRGDVCKKCFDEFDGVTIEELKGEF